VRDGTPARATFGWVDLARLKKDGVIPKNVSDIKGKAQFGNVLGVVNTQLLNVAVTFAEKTGIDLFTASQAFGTGEPPRRAVRLDGADTDTFRSALEKLGARPLDAHGRHFLAIGKEGSIDIKGPLTSLGVLNELDRVAIDGDRVAWGPFEEPVDEMLGGSGSSLADNPSFAEAADCLGDVAAAQIVPASLASIDGPAVLVAIGIPPFGTKPPYHEVLCVVTLGKGPADTYADGLRKGLAPDTVEWRSNQHMSTLISDSDVSVVEGHDRAAARADITLAGGRPPGLLLQALFSRGLGAFMGQQRPPIP
jgi:hypothetical protein